MASIRVLDLSRYPTADLLASPLLEQASELGFVYLTGLPDLLEAAKRVFAISERFFHGETAQNKQACAITNNRGYASVGQEALDPSKPNDVKENFNLGLMHDAHSQPLPPLLSTHLQELQRLQKLCHETCQLLLEAFAIALGLDRRFFISQHTFNSSNSSILRLLRYPPGPAPQRAGAHSDYGSLTLLFQQDIGGLQVLPPRASPNDEVAWVDVDIVPDAVLVNVGDALEFWTGCRLKSTLHRVVSPKSGESHERYSIAFFNQALGDAPLHNVLDTFEDISAADLERMERKGVKRGATISADEHLQARLAATYKRPS